LIDHFDSQAFAPALPHQHGLELAALYTLQYRLPRNAEFHGGLQHRQIFWRRLLHDARAQFINAAICCKVNASSRRQTSQDGDAILRPIPQGDSWMIRMNLPDAEGSINPS
jgi:hypothetical protein